MPLAEGTTLGHYTIVGPLGAGGMGEVYRAEDTRLRREVAIKVLPAGFADDPERLERFVREARALAALNHSNVATIHGADQDGDTHFLAMELVPGSDLSERLARGPLPADEAVPLFCQIAEGLAAAHAAGIVHRDLKPANIKVSDGGQVKILDFGLARALLPEGPAADLSHSPTMTANATRAGVLLGTAAYMSPEQAQGIAADERADIWAWGVCLYEALTGERAFGGDNASLTLAAVLKEDPDLERVEPRFQRLLARCLEKDPERRYRDITDVRLDLEEAASRPAEAAPSATPSQREAVAWSLAGLLLLATVLLLVRGGSRPEPAPVERFEVAAPHFLTTETENVALSPDGRTIVYLARDDRGRRLYRRSLASLEAEPIPGTEGGWGHHFFSPDGQWIAFNGLDSLKKVRLDGGGPIELHEGLFYGGGDWSAEGTLLVTLDYRVQTIPAEGGQLAKVTELSDDEIWHQHARWLREGETFLFSAISKDGSESIVWKQLGEQGHTPLIEGRKPYLLADDLLLFEREDALWVVPFDPRAPRTLGEAQPLTELPYNPKWSAVFAASRNGSLIYMPRDEGARGELIWLERDGRESPLGLPRAAFFQPRLSPDGRRVAFVTLDGLGSFGSRGTGELLVLELGTRRPQRIGIDGLTVRAPLWTPDSQGLVFEGFRQGTGGRLRRWNGSRVEAFGPQSADLVSPDAWTRDLQVLTTFFRPGTLGDISAVDPLSGEEESLLGGAENTRAVTLSPDRRWMAYQVDSPSGTRIMVRPFPDVESAGPWHIADGIWPLWARQNELLYLRGNTLMSQPLSGDAPFIESEPSVVVQGPYFIDSLYFRPYDYDPRGDRFLVVKDRPKPPSLVVVQGLDREIAQRSQ